MKKYKVGLLTMSDGRPYLHGTQFELNMACQRDLAAALEATGLVEVVAGSGPVNSARMALEEARRLKEAGVEMTIFNYAIWCYPHFTAAACNLAPGPYVLFCNLHPSECGMVGMLAAAGTLDQLGLPYERVWGSIKDSQVLERVMRAVRAFCGVGRLRGHTYGNFGGRPMGMYTAVANLDQWQRQFGIDVEDMEQTDIIRYGEAVSQDKVANARLWLESHARQVAYNDTNFTPEKLESQIRSYYGLRAIIEERGLDFIGIKAHGDLTDWYVTMDLAEAFLNDPYDWDGPHEPIVAATESDMDGALTMELFKLMTGQPVLFADVRHYEASEGLWFFSNSGTHATYFAGASQNPAENMKEVSLLPETKDYPAGGGSVHHFAHPGPITFARLARRQGEYELTLVPGEIVRLPQARMEELGALATPQWPVAFARLKVRAEDFLAQYPCNHIHGVYGDWTREWLLAARALGIPARVLAPAGVGAD